MYVCKSDFETGKTGLYGLLYSVVPHKKKKKKKKKIWWVTLKRCQHLDCIARMVLTWKELQKEAVVA
jgi:hypothetical protein